MAASRNEGLADDGSSSEPVLPSLPTPPDTPAAPPQHNTHVFPVPQDYHDYGNGYFEENNNMDENSNDQQYEQYSHYHAQHFLSQQYQPNHQLPRHLQNHDAQNASSQDEESHSWNNVSLSSNNYDRNSSSTMNASLHDDSLRSRQSNSNNSFANPSTFNERSVRARPPGQCRMSLADKLTSNPSTEQQHKRSREHSRSSIQPVNSDVPDDSRIHPSVGNLSHGLVTKDASTPQSRHRTHRPEGHQRNSSYDSGMDRMAEMAEWERRNSQSEPERNLPRLPQPHMPHSGVESLPQLPSRASSTERDARLLLYHFTQEQLSREQLSLPSDMATHLSLAEGNLFRAGSELRRLADAFAATPGRHQVKSMAENVSIANITWENFASLCLELFSGPAGITVERIVALFTFISDVAKIQIKRGAEAWLRRVMEWSLRFIVERVCSWVQQAGGWGVVLSRGLDVVYRVALTVSAVLAGVALTLYISRNIRN